LAIRFAILGAGRIGLVHAQAIASNPQAQLVAVADPFVKSANNLIAAFGGALRSIEEIADAKDVDAVLICTPTNTHADLIEKFARAGKAIFCEKPIDLNLDRVKSCLAVVKENKAKLMVGFNRRFDPHFVALKNTIDAGTIGDVEMVNIVSRDPGPPPYEYIEVSGGIFKDMTIHDFDMARFLLDEDIDSVFASASVLVDAKIGDLSDFDSANVIMTTASGKQCSISNSRRATYGYDQRIEVLGSQGMVNAKNQRPVSIEVATSQGFTRPPLHDFFMTRYTQAYAAEITTFIATITNNTESLPSGDDGLYALAIAEAARMSVNTGRSVKLAQVI